MTPEQIEIEGIRLVAPMPDYTNVHLSHCNQDEYVGVCKYGDEDCPALARCGDTSTPEALELRGAECGDCDAVARHYVNSRAVCCRHYAQRMNVCCSCTSSVGFTSDVKLTEADYALSSVRSRDTFKARVAALLGSLLGGPIMGGGILEELRAVRSELKDEGY